MTDSAIGLKYTLEKLDWEETGGQRSIANLKHAPLTREQLFKVCHLTNKDAARALGVSTIEVQYARKYLSVPSFSQRKSSQVKVIENHYGLSLGELLSLWTERGLNYQQIAGKIQGDLCEIYPDMFTRVYRETIRRWIQK